MAIHDESEAAQLISTLTDMKLFKSQTGDTYAACFVAEAYHIMPIAGKDFGRFLLVHAETAMGKIVKTSTINSVVSQLDARAAVTGRRIPLDVRFAQRDRTIWLDLVDKKRRAVKITAEEWKAVRLRKVIFRRYAHQTRIPQPKRGGDAKEIFKYLNLADDGQKLMVLAWLGCTFIANIPRPILFLSGAHGSGKTTQAKILRSLVDPSAVQTVPLLSRDADLAQLLQHHAIPVFDNLTWIKSEVSDRLCSAVTGSGFVKRGLYTDDSDVIYDFKRPMIITSLNTPTNAPDLLDRSILIRTDMPKKLLDDLEIWNGFNKVRRRILGGLLDCVSGALQRIDDVKIAHPPRMVDFAHWGTAIALAAGYKKHEFIDALSENSYRQVNEVIQSSPVADAIRGLVKRGSWKGSPTKLLHELNNVTDDSIRGRGWPKAPNHLSRHLNTLIMPMKAVAVEIRMGKSSKGKIVELNKIKRKTR